MARKKKSKFPSDLGLSEEEKAFIKSRKVAKNIEKVRLERIVAAKEKILSKKEKAFLEKREFEKAIKSTRGRLQAEKFARVQEKVFLKGRSVPTHIKQVDTKISTGARKLINVLAPRGGMVKRLTQTSKKGTGAGRGRPKGTYKARILPSGKIVKVPTHIYKKMLSQEKAQYRLAAAQKQAMMQEQMQQAEQVAMAQDPRFQAGRDDAFLSETDQVHEMNVQRAQERARMAQFAQESMPQQQKGPSIVSRVAGGISRLGGLAMPRRTQPIQYDQFGRVAQHPQLQIQKMGQEMGIKGEPRVTAISTKASLLKVPNIFNKPGEAVFIK